MTIRVFTAWQLGRIEAFFRLAKVLKMGLSDKGEIIIEYLNSKGDPQTDIIPRYIEDKDAEFEIIQPKLLK